MLRNSREKILESMLDTAMDIAQLAHLGQFRRGSKLPYITHPVRVQAIAARFGYPKMVQIAAIVHDAIEDAQDPEQIIRMIRRYIPQVLPIIQAVTRKKGMSYLDYIRSISGSALQLKLSDMLHNLLDNPSLRQREKYRQALEAIRADRGGVPIEINQKHWNELAFLVDLSPLEEHILREFIAVSTILN